MSKIVLDLIKSTEWAIEPKKFDEMLEVLRNKEAMELLKENNPRFKSSTQADSDMKMDDVGIIPVSGPLTKRLTLLNLIFGGTSYSAIQSQFKEMMATADVSSIVLRIDSGGGTIDGLQDVVDLMRKMKGRKPVYAFIDGFGASAAYMVASGADEIIASNKTAQIGSLGVVTVHFDLSGAYEKIGAKATVLQSGKYKSIGHQYGGLSKGDIEKIQEKLDYLYSLMIQDVATNRKTSAKTTDERMGQGRLFFAEEAIQVGLVDKIESWDSLLNRLQGKGSNKKIMAQSERNQMKFKNYSLIDIIKKVQSVDNLDELSELEQDLLSEADRRKVSVKNWIQESEAKGLKDNIASLIAQRRRMILAVPKSEKGREEFNLGQSVGRRVLNIK